MFRKLPPCRPWTAPELRLRKKVNLRKEKRGDLPREGRRLAGGSTIKTRKIRVRRPQEEPPAFHIVFVYFY